MDKFQILKTAATATYGALGTWTYDSYAEINQRYFNGEIQINGVQWGLTPHGGSLAFYSPWFDTITLHQSLLESPGNPWGMGRLLGKRLAYDVLLHEMIHQLLHQQKLYGSTDDAHHCQVWCNELNRLGRLLSLPHYYTLYRKTTKRVPIKNSIFIGRYCDLETRRVRKPPTKAKSVWVPIDTEAAAKANSLGLLLADMRHLTTFPHSSRPPGYYTQAEQTLIDETYLDTLAEHQSV